MGREREVFEPVEELHGLGERSAQPRAARHLVAGSLVLLGMTALFAWARQSGASSGTIVPRLSSPPGDPTALWRAQDEFVVDKLVYNSTGGNTNMQQSNATYTPSQIFAESYPGYPECQSRVLWMAANWNASSYTYHYYASAGVDGTVESFLNYLNQHGLYCPAAGDRVKDLIRGVCLGGWLVLEPWIVPSLFEQFDPALNVRDEWGFCQALGPSEALRQLERHYDTWVTEADIEALYQAGVNTVRIPVGYWIMGDIRPGEPWVDGGLKYLQRAMGWLKARNMSVLFDLHAAPGSQNGFDNSGRSGPIHWGDPSFTTNGTVFYPNLDRSLTVIEGLVSVFSLEPFVGTVRWIELVNEAFITIPIDVVKRYYLEGYAAVRRLNSNIGIVIGDSFRFGSWNNFMYPPNWNHVYIDTHIYQVFDSYHLSMTAAQHVQLTCTQSLPMVAVAPLSTIVGEWSAAMTDCAQWLNGYLTGSRFDGTFQNAPFMGSCEGQNDPDSAVFTPAYIRSLRLFANAQMQAYEAGSAMGWFFWNFKTENAPQWNYLLGLERGWIPKQSERQNVCVGTASDTIGVQGSNPANAN